MHKNAKSLGMLDPIALPTTNTRPSRQNRVLRPVIPWAHHPCSRFLVILWWACYNSSFICWKYMEIYMDICGNSGDICWKYMHIYPVISWHTLNNYKLLNPLGTRNALCIYLETAIPSTDMFLLNLSIKWNVISPGSSITYPSWLAIRSQWWMVFPAQ
jgi:hypothetical protein